MRDVTGANDPPLTERIGIPVTVPEDPGEREPPLQKVDLFTRPGETREIPHRD